MKRVRGAAVGIVISCFAVACTIMNGLELPADTNLGDGGGSSSGKDGGSTTLPDGRVVQPATDGAAGCVLNHPPPLPAPAGGTDSATPIEMALSSMVSTNNGSAPAGWDLDNLCTCPDKPPCTTKGALPCDFNNNGTDNAGTNINKNLNGSIDPVGDSNNRIANDATGFLVQLTQYNQQPNDEAVQVTLYRSTGASEGTVNFNQKQHWPASSIKYVSTTAWVNNNVLVANFDAVEVPFLDGIVNPAMMRHAILSGPLASGSSGLSMASAVIAGRVSTNEIIASIGQLAVPQFGIFVCQAPQYQSFGSQTCQVQDINLDPSQDSAGTAACDALSLVVTMNLVPATIQGSNDPDPPDDHCTGQTPIQCN